MPRIRGRGNGPRRPGGHFANAEIPPRLLWKGRVAEPDDDEDASTVALREFNQHLMRRPQLEALVLPLGDGLGIATKV